MNQPKKTAQTRRVMTTINLPTKYLTGKSVPKRYDIFVWSRKPITKEIRETIYALDEQLEKHTEWILPPKRKK